MIRKEKNKKVIEVFKPIGKTPLDIVKEIKAENPFIEKIGYAGRLDPMAEGLLLLLVGEENKNKKKYEDLSKVYEAEILLGFSTDTYDILGKIKEANFDCVSPSKNETVKTLKSFKGKYSQPYPPYSSKTFKGKPLYYWARKGFFPKSKTLTKEVEIYSLEKIQLKFISGEDLMTEILKRIEKVKGDFRQDEIIKNWQNVLECNKSMQFPLVSLTIKSSAGVYVRHVANEFGKRINIPSLAYSIKRISIGNYKLSF